MQINIQSIPGYAISEYLLVLSPPEELRSKILQVKKDFYQSYKANSALGGKAYIPLASFSQFAMIEERLINRLKTIAMGYHPFKVELKNFGSFPSHSIFIQVLSKDPVKKLVKEIKTAQHLMKPSREIKPFFFEEPHLTIARKLLPWQYENGWLEFSRRSFTGRFIAESMLLLKRRAGDKAYQIAARFEFMNLPVATRQGELFLFE